MYLRANAVDKLNPVRYSNPKPISYLGGLQFVHLLAGTNLTPALVIYCLNFLVDSLLESINHKTTHKLSVKKPEMGLRFGDQD